MEFDTSLDVLSIGVGIVMGLLATKPMHPVLKLGLYGLGGLLIVGGVLGMFGLQFRSPIFFDSPSSPSWPTTVPNLLIWLVLGLLVLTVVGIVIFKRRNARLLVSPQDAANREQIISLLRGCGYPASGDLYQVMREVLQRFYDLCDSEGKIEAHKIEGLRIIARLAYNGPLVSWSSTLQKLGKVVSGSDKMTVPSLYHFVGDFFREYQNLVRWVNWLNQFQLLFVAENEKRGLNFKPALVGREYESWRRNHEMFHQQLHGLLELEEFSQLQRRISGEWHETFR